MVHYFNGYDGNTRYDVNSNTIRFGRNEKYAIVNNERIENSNFDFSGMINSEKNLMKSFIRQFTKRKINDGFYWGSEHFGSSLEDQSNWSSLLFAASQNMISYPTYVQNWSGVAVAFSNKQELLDCFNSGLVMKSTYLQTDAMYEEKLNSINSFSGLLNFKKEILS